MTAATGRPVPQPTELTQPYWDATLRGELLFIRCRKCDTVFFPPLEACISCQSEDIGWQRSAGRGAVYTFTVLHDGPSAGFPVPSVLAIIDLDEGYSMFSSVVGCPPADVRIDMRVEVCFEELSPDIHLPVFRPVEATERG